MRMILRTSIGGRRARVKLSNAFNGTPVEIGAAHIAIRDRDSAIVAGSDRALTFAGRPSIKMTPGMVVVSDPVDLTVAPLADLAVSLYFPATPARRRRTRPGCVRPTSRGEGDFTGGPTIPDATTRMSYYWLAAVEVDAPAGTPLIVAFGDSITDGARSTPDTHNTWPAILATRLAADKATAHFAIVNQGIGGNRVLTDGAGLAGVSALARFDRDVLSQPGVQWLMMLEGINDIGSATAQTANSVPITAEDLIWGLRQIVDRAHQHGIKVVGCTILPVRGRRLLPGGRRRPSGRRSTSGFERLVATTPSSTSTPRPATRPTHGGCGRSSIPAITCTRMTRATARWQKRST